MNHRNIYDEDGVLQLTTMAENEWEVAEELNSTGNFNLFSRPTPAQQQAEMLKDENYSSPRSEVAKKVKDYVPGGIKPPGMYKYEDKYFVQEIWESIRDAVQAPGRAWRGEFSPEEAMRQGSNFGMNFMGGAAGARVADPVGGGRGSVGILGDRILANPVAKKLSDSGEYDDLNVHQISQGLAKLAEVMAKSEQPPADIWKATGQWQTPLGEWRSLIDLRPVADMKVPTSNKEMQAGRGKRVAEVFDLPPELTEAGLMEGVDSIFLNIKNDSDMRFAGTFAPSDKTTRLVDSEGTTLGALRGLQDSEVTLNLHYMAPKLPGLGNTLSPGEVIKTLFHELQHAFQTPEGMPQGGAPEGTVKMARDAKKKVYRQLPVTYNQELQMEAAARAKVLRKIGFTDEVVLADARRFMKNDNITDDYLLEGLGLLSKYIKSGELDGAYADKLAKFGVIADADPDLAYMLLQAELEARVAGTVASSIRLVRQTHPDYKMDDAWYVDHYKATYEAALEDLSFSLLQFEGAMRHAAGKKGRVQDVNTPLREMGPIHINEQGMLQP